MNMLATLDPYGVLTEPTTLTISRLLPGPIDRCWAYLTDGELRRQWLAAGTMDLTVGAPFEFVWRNDELGGSPGQRPEGFPAEQRMKGRILEVDPPRRLTFSWFESGSVTLALEPQGKDVLLTVTHRGIPDRSVLLNVSAGWHAHLDILVARVRGEAPKAGFWDGWKALKAEYDERLQG